MTIDITSPTFATTLAAPYTLEQCHTFLKQAFANAGFPAPLAEALSSTNITVYEFDLNPSATFGKFHFVLETTISGTTINIRCRLHHHTNYNEITFTPTASTGANNTTGASTNVSTTVALTAFSIPTTEEIFGVKLLENGVFDSFLGMAYFSAKEPWYDENLYCWAMLVQPTIMNSFWLPYPNPQSGAATTAIPCRAQINTFSARNTVDTKPYVVTAPYITLHSWGVGGQFPTDIGVTNSVGLLPGDILVTTPGVEEYWLAQPLDNGVAFRCV